MMPESMEQFEDEPLTSSGRAKSKSSKKVVKQKKIKAPKIKAPKIKAAPKPKRGGTAGSTMPAFQIEGMGEAMSKEERKKERRKKRRKALEERTGKIVVVCCCCSIIAAIIVAIVLSDAFAKSNGNYYEKQANRPTPAPVLQPVVPDPIVTPEPKPTRMPVPTPMPVTTKKPTPRPTRPPIPSTPAPVKPPTPLQDEYVLKPNQDTYIYKDGLYKTKAFGKEETFLVQNGPRSKNVPDAFALIAFDTSEIPSLDLLATSGKKAVLRLTHKPATLGNQDRQPAPMTVSRLRSTSLDVETLHGGDFEYPKHIVDGPTVDVSTTAKAVTIDITDLVWDTPFVDDMLFLMLEARGQEQEAGDYFFSRESDTPPQLTLSNLRVEQDGDV
jgi:hypothetical protein